MTARPPELLRMPPMNGMQLLDAGVRLYRENFFLFAAITMIPTVPLYLLQLGSIYVFREQMAHIQTHVGSTSPEQLQALAIVLGNGFIFMILELGFGVPLATGALTAAVSNRYLGRPTTIGGAFRPVFRVFWSYILTTALVSMVFAIAGLAFCCTFGIFFCLVWVWFMCTPCVQILEGTSGLPAMTRSRELSRGHGWRMFGASLWLFFVYLTVKVSLPTVIAQLSINQFESPVLYQAGYQSIATVVGAVLDPFWSILRIMFYYDLRIRKEGYDLAINGERLALASPLE